MLSSNLLRKIVYNIKCKSNIQFENVQIKMKKFILLKISTVVLLNLFFNKNVLKFFL